MCGSKLVPSLRFYTLAVCCLVLECEHYVEPEVQHGNTKVNQAMIEQVCKASYCASTFFTTPVVEEAAKIMVDSTDGHMSRAYIVNSGQQAAQSFLVRKAKADWQQGPRRWKQP